MKIIILGSNGILGHILFLLLIQNKKNKVLGLCGESVIESKFYLQHSQNLEIINLSDINSIKNKIKKFKPNFIINCAVKKNKPTLENEYYNYIFINSILPHILASLTDKYNFKLIHISTDSVLGNNFISANEVNQYNSNDFYSASKLIGEVLDNKNTITLRTSIIGHSLSGNKGLLDWVIGSKKIIGFDKCIYSGTTALEISKLIIKIIHHNNFNEGLFHVGAIKISKYKLIKKLCKIYKLDTSIVVDKINKISRILDSKKFNKLYNYKVPEWDTLLLETKIFYQKNKFNYD